MAGDAPPPAAASPPPAAASPPPAAASLPPPSPLPSPPISTLDGTDDSPFQCCICLDLLYKPVVLACGHISCFWCVHKAMHGFRTSNCAICRHPYNHFPSICQLLHHLLLKIAYVEYKRRETEVLEEERLADVFSPQYIDAMDSETVHNGNAMDSETVHNGKKKGHFLHKQSGNALSDKHKSGTSEEIEKPDENMKKNRTIASEESRLPENGLKNGMHKPVSLTDVLCAMCKKLLFKPAVLNCGHVVCESCLPGLTGSPLSCCVCQSPHPGELPNVCLDLDQFLAERFPTEYTARRDQVHLQEKHSLSGGLQTADQKGESSSCARKKRDLPFDEDLPNAHFGVGCDSCGVYPIIGNRYKCKDCKEIIGFDLCDACYNTNSKLAGRFNQQHTPDHQFELVDSKMFGRMLSFASMPLDDADRLYVEVFMSGDEVESEEEQSDVEEPEAEDHFDINRTEQ